MVMRYPTARAAHGRAKAKGAGIRPQHRLASSETARQDPARNPGAKLLASGVVPLQPCTAAPTQSQPGPGHTRSSAAALVLVLRRAQHESCLGWTAPSAVTGACQYWTHSPGHFQIGDGNAAVVKVSVDPQRHGRVLDLCSGACESATRVDKDPEHEDQTIEGSRTVRPAKRATRGGLLSQET